MRPFTYLCPRTIDEATAMLGREGALPIAGGTDLVVQMKAGLISPRYLVDMTKLGLAYIREEEGSLRIGAATTLEDVSASEAVRRSVSVLAEAAGQIGSVQTRCLATIGGNLCSGVPSADTAPALLVLSAQMHIVGPRGARVVPIEEFFLGPRQTVVCNDELLIEIEVPAQPPRAGWSFLKLGRRKAMTLAVVNTAALLWLAEDGDTIQGIRIAVGAVAPTPLRALRAESSLQGCSASQAIIDVASTRVVDEIAPIGDVRATAEYRRATSSVIVKRALVQAWHRATEKDGHPYGAANPA